MLQSSSRKRPSVSSSEPVRMRLQSVSLMTMTSIVQATTTRIAKYVRKRFVRVRLRPAAMASARAATDAMPALVRERAHSTSIA